MSTVIITGASRGIGRAAARRFAGAGWRAALGYSQSEEDVRALERELTASGARVSVFRADVGRAAEAEAMIHGAAADMGPPDALVLCAGVAYSALLQDTGEDDWARVFDVNAGGTYRCIRAALPYMLRRKAGRIITVSSVWGMTGAACEAAYSASKAAVIGLTRALAKELGPSGITVNCVAPGVVETEMNAGLSPDERAALCGMTPLGRFGTPEEIAESIFFLASDQAGFITGQVLSPNGGFVV